MHFSGVQKKPCVIESRHLLTSSYHAWFFFKAFPVFSFSPVKSFPATPNVRHSRRDFFSTFLCEKYVSESSFSLYEKNPTKRTGSSKPRTSLLLFNFECSHLIRKFLSGTNQVLCSIRHTLAIVHNMICLFYQCVR